ncbi:MAG TPA: tRNA (adenosine(37)-N6)-dimethylallyltransferase MiaA [Gemmatimonadaceae bacterium]|nr:tRNA (adenosine(37)-N6)-dimethylallyltransferase MiaA [Gemmatimonadaceae bacterium]
MDGNSLRVIVGPTAAGKSALAMSLAESHRATIVNADSRQIYRGFDIGTGKPTREERVRVRHDGVDVADPHERWSAAHFGHAAGDWLADAARDGRTPVVVGGTGFWVAALVRPLAPMPTLDGAARARIAVELDALSHDELRARCAELDPPVAKLGHAQWRRAIEVTLITGRRLSEWQQVGETPARAVRYLLVDPGESLRARIGVRIDAMLAGGWVDEVRSLATNVASSAIAWKSCGYERLRAALANGDSIASVRNEVEVETWQYARRQRTWFRRQLKYGPVTRLDPAAPDAIERARAWWNGKDDA